MIRSVTIASLALWAAILSGCSTEESEIPGEGQWRLINYWAIWCKPCREEIPALNEVDQLPNVVVLGINFDRKRGDELVSQAAELGITFQLLEIDVGEQLGVPRPQGLPITVVVSPDGAVVETLYGPQTKNSLLTAIEAHAGA